VAATATGSQNQGSYHASHPGADHNYSVRLAQDIPKNFVAASAGAPTAVYTAPTYLSAQEPGPALDSAETTITPMGAIVAVSNLKDDSEDVTENETVLKLADAASWGNFHDCLGPPDIALALMAIVMKDQIRNVGLSLFDVESSDNESSDDEFSFNLTGL
jgi:hypothetical protein